MYSILIVEDNQFSLENLVLSLQKNYSLLTSTNIKDALEKLRGNKVNVVIVDIKLPGENGLKLIEKTKPDYPDLKYIVITGYSDEESIIQALKLGADDLLKKPYDEKELHNSIKKQITAIELEKENKLLKERLQKENIVLKKELDKNLELKEDKIIGESPSLMKVLKDAKKIAGHKLNTLICGESGTGKELLARYIHRNGPRFDKPFIPVNCASLTPNLFESELFGHEKGSFTNAYTERIGMFEVANGGIIFLDEITEINLDLQAKLLRVVEEKRVQRVGSNIQRLVDVQILSSTNRDINKTVNSGLFRADLYHRLAEITISLPPLRDRKEDIPKLLDYFKNKYDSLFNIQSKEISGTVLQRIESANWSGNIRQLSNFMKKWCLFGGNTDFNEIELWLTNENNVNINSEDSFRFELGTMHELEEAKSG